MRDTTDPDGLAFLRVHALFISDVHLGTRTAQAGRLFDLLRFVEADTLYLVGDIIDFWKVRRGPHWPQSHNDVLQQLMRKVRKGTRLVLVPGNHDEGLRDYAGMQFGDVEIHRDAVHVTAQGRRYLVMHGDEFDVVVRTAKWLALLGDRGYELALWLNRPLNWVRRHLGKSGEEVRGIVLLDSLPDDLGYAAAAVSDSVEFKLYQVELTLESVIV